MGYVFKRRSRSGDDPPDAPPPDPPKGNQGPGAANSDATPTSAENGAGIPIAYGTVRAPSNVIERYAYSFAATEAGTRTKSASVSLGQILSNAGNLYICRVAGTTGTGDGPSGTSSGQIDGGVTWDYVKMGYRHLVALAYCEGQVTGAGKAWQDKNVFAAYTSIPHDGTFLQLNLGTPSGGRTTPSWFPIQTDVYGNLVVLWAQLATGSDADLPDTALEIAGIFTASVGDDANPADIATDLLTHSRRGAGLASAFVDATSTGSGAASLRTYATAAGFNVSWLIDSQQSVKKLLETLLAACNTDAYMTNRADGSGWMIRFVPRGTDSITANGVTFTPNLTPAYALTVDDFLSEIEVDTTPETDTYNCWPIEYVDRASDYKRITVDDPDMADIDLLGLRAANTTSLPMVMAPASAIQLSRIFAQRSLNVVNTWRIEVGFRFALVEPTDLLTATDGAIGVNGAPVRVVVFEEDQETGNIRLECEDFPANVGAAASYTPAANDGFKPTVPTALGSLQVLPGQAGAGSVPISATTIGNKDSLFPNYNSETPPPDGADTSKPEWAGRTASASAYAGGWVRQLTAALNSNQQLGDTISTSIIGVTTQSQLGLHLPCSPGESYYIEAQAKWITVTGAEQCGVYMYFLDASGAKVGTGSANTPNSGGVGAGWSKVTAIGTAPAGAVTLRLFCFMNATLGAATAQFDAIVARKVVDPVVLGKLGGNVVDEIQGAAMKALGRLTSGSASAVPPTISVDKVWYRGNCDNTALQGAPNISRLTVSPTLWNTTLQHCRYTLRLQPTAVNDNLDGMRYAEITLYRQSAAGTSGTLTQLALVRVPLTDRLYKVPGTDSDTGNQVWATDSITDPGINGGVPAMLITLYNVNGPSDTHCFYAGSTWTAGTALTDNGQNWPAGLLGGTAGGGGGGGNVGGNCLDPETPVLIAPGKLAPLHAIREGDLLWTRPEGGGEMGFHSVAHASIERNARCKVKFTDGRWFKSSVNHLINVRGIWRRADSLQVGEEVQGDPGGLVANVEYLGEGPVVRLTLPTAGTYFAGDGVWHHNVFKP